MWKWRYRARVSRYVLSIFFTFSLSLSLLFLLVSSYLLSDLIIGFIIEYLVIGLFSLNNILLSSNDSLKKALGEKDIFVFEVEKNSWYKLYLIYRDQRDTAEKIRDSPDVRQSK